MGRLNLDILEDDRYNDSTLSYELKRTTLHLYTSAVGYRTSYEVHTHCYRGISNHVDTRYL